VKVPCVNLLDPAVELTDEPIDLLTRDFSISVREQIF
jgi:hypothetical protein